MAIKGSKFYLYPTSRLLTFFQEPKAELFGKTFRLSTGPWVCMCPVFRSCFCVCGFLADVGVCYRFRPDVRQFSVFDRLLWRSRARDSIYPPDGFQSLRKILSSWRILLAIARLRDGFFPHFFKYFFCLFLVPLKFRVQKRGHRIAKIWPKIWQSRAA